MGLLKKGSKIYSVWNMKCPRCHTGDLFETGSFSFQKSFEMPGECPNCKLNYMPQPGFYYGSMFISYIFTGFFSLGFVMILHWVFGWSLTASMLTLMAVFGIFFVWIFRMARSVWINMVIHYDPKFVPSNP